MGSASAPHAPLGARDADRSSDHPSLTSNYSIDEINKGIAGYTDEEKTKMFNDSFNALNQLNTDMLLSNIESITLPDGVVVDDQTQIKEFVENAESKLIKDLENSLVKVRQQGTMKPVRVQSNEEQIKNGAPTNYEVPITFDNANFFV